MNLRISKQPLRLLERLSFHCSKAFMDGVQRILVEKGYDEAIVHSEQFFQSTDLNAELVRVMTICRRYNLKPEAAAQVFDYLRRIQSNGKD